MLWSGVIAVLVGGGLGALGDKVNAGFLVVLGGAIALIGLVAVLLGLLWLLIA